MPRTAPQDHECQDERIDTRAELEELRQFEENEVYNQMRDIWFRENPAGPFGDPYAHLEYEDEDHA